MKKHQMAMLAGYLFLIAGVIGSVTAWLRFRHLLGGAENLLSGTQLDAIAHYGVVSPLLVLIGIVWLVVARKFKKKDSERI